MGVKDRPQFEARAPVAFSDHFYEMARANQAETYRMTEEILRKSRPDTSFNTRLDRIEAHNERIMAVSETEVAATMQQNDERLQAGLELASAIQNLGLNLVVSIGLAELRGGRQSVMQAQVNQARQTQRISLQNDFYVRPWYEPDRGWSLTLVNLKTGRRADILLSPNNKPLSQAAPNLPAFCIDPSSSQILSKGLGLDPSKFVSYQKLAVGLGKRVVKWNIPYPSVLAFDLRSLSFATKPETRPPLPPPLVPEKQMLNDELMNAAFQNNLDAVKKALDAGADVNAVDAYGQTALMLAGESLKLYCKKNIVEMLLNRDADISVKDPEGWTAVDHFVIWGFDAYNSGASKGLDLLLKAQQKASQKEPEKK
jgi:hypothetical protein